MRHMRTFLVEKEWDKEVGSQIREKRIVVGYNTISKANTFCYTMNQECSNCPRRAALHTKYEVIAPPVYIRIENETT